MARAKITKILITMVKTEIFAELMSAVSSETEIPPEVIASGDRSAEAVDARYLLVYLLHRRGFYASTIAPFLGHRKRSINHILSDFEHRLSVTPMMQVCLERLKRQQGGAIDVGHSGL